jgi:hypothetical protein
MEIFYFIPTQPTSISLLPPFVCINFAIEHPVLKFYKMTTVPFLNQIHLFRNNHHRQILIKNRITYFMHEDIRFTIGIFWNQVIRRRVKAT